MEQNNRKNANEESEEELIPQVFDADFGTEESGSSSNSIFDKIKEAKQMLDVGIVREEEFTEIKAKLIAHM